MRRRLLNQTEGDPAQEAIDAFEAVRLADIARIPRLQPHIATRAERERATNDKNGGASPAVFQAPGKGMSSQPERLPPVPAAPQREKLRLKRLNEA